MSDVEENVENVENVDQPSFLSVMVLVDEKLDVDEVEEVLEDDEVMELVEAEDLVRQRAEEARLHARALVSRSGDQGPDIADLAGCPQPSTTRLLLHLSLSLLLGLFMVVHLVVLVSVLVLRGSVPGCFSSSWSSKAFYRLWREGERLLLPLPSSSSSTEGRRQLTSRHLSPTTRGFLLGAQLGQLSLSFNSGRTLSKVEVLHDSQQQMLEHQLQLLRRQQVQAAENKVNQ